MVNIINDLKRIETIHAQLLRNALKPRDDLLVLEAQEITQNLITDMAA